MPDHSLSKSDKVQSTRASQWLGCLLVMVVLMGALMFGLYDGNQLLAWSSNPWGKLSPSTKQSNETFNGSSMDPTIAERFFVAYPHRYHFVVDEADKCQQQNPFLVVMVPVAPQNREARDSIRKTWGREPTVLGQTVSLYFLLGLTNERQGAEQLQQQVLEESQEHHDVLQADFVDSYQNLTIKTMLLLEWFTSHCPSASYVMKIDSDMFLNAHNLVQILLQAPRHNYMTGLVARSAPVLRDPTSKWYLPEEAFAESQYPAYALGLGYVMSSDLPRKIVEASRYVKAVYIEDVYLGMCMRHLGIKLTDPPHEGLFKAGPPQERNSCYWSFVITTILNSPKQLLDIWREYQTKTPSDCKRDIQDVQDH